MQDIYYQTVYNRPQGSVYVRERGLIYLLTTFAVDGSTVIIGIDPKSGKVMESYHLKPYIRLLGGLAWAV
jgi:virulence-associated protein VapD